jgi:SNF2 family DNA or RNA helicase
MNYPYKTLPFDHQREALRRSAALHAFGWLMEQGTGKSKVGLDNAAWLYMREKLDCLIILAPAGVHNTWILDQVPEHLPGTVPAATVLWRSGSSAIRRQLHSVVLERKLVIAAFNIDAINTDEGYRAVKELCEARVAMMLIDESSDIAHPSAARTRAAWQLSRLAKYRRIMDGTPFAESPLEAYAQFRFLDPRILGFHRYRQYKDFVGQWRSMELRKDTFPERKNRIFQVQLTDPRTGEKLWRRDNIEIIKQRMAPYVYRVTRDVLGLKERIYARHMIELSAEQRKLYDDLTKQWEAECANGLILTVANRLALMVRQQQIVSGYVPGTAWVTVEDDEEVIQPDHIIPGPRPRIEAALSLYRHYQVPTIVWARFRKDIDQLSAAFLEAGVSVARYDGAMNEDERQISKSRFLNGAAEIFLGNAAVAGRGLTLNRAKHAIYYNNYIRARLREQSEDRFYRIGQTDSVLVTDIEAIDTVDYPIRLALKAKKSLSNMMTNDLEFPWQPLRASL